MAELIAIVGESGSGKTTSLRNLNPEETFIFSTTGKKPGVKGAARKYPQFESDPDNPGKYRGNFCTVTKVEQLEKILAYVNRQMPHIKYVVADD